MRETFGKVEVVCMMGSCERAGKFATLVSEAIEEKPEVRSGLRGNLKKYAVNNLNN
jgi:hypothetical protein